MTASVPPSDRTGAFLDRLDHLSVDDLIVLALAPWDPDEADRLRERAEQAAEDAGRIVELDEAVDRAGAMIVRAFSFRGLEPTWFGLNWGRSLARAEDRARLFTAIEDGAMAAVVADLVPEEAGILGDPFEIAASMRGTAPSTNPSSSVHRNAVRLAWVSAAFGWIALGAQLTIDLVADILADRIDPFFR
ncbi:MAG TPA: hypothetical protein VGJ71_10745 [Candidatus Limnocylindrales bacterium]|jgi:hypothetical protein